MTIDAQASRHLERQLDQSQAVIDAAAQLEADWEKAKTAMINCLVCGGAIYTKNARHFDNQNVRWEASQSSEIEKVLDCCMTDAVEAGFWARRARVVAATKLITDSEDALQKSWMRDELSWGEE